MVRLLKEGSVDKYYLCIVKGKVESKHRIEANAKDTKKNGNYIIGERIIPLLYVPNTSHFIFPNQKKYRGLKNTIHYCR